MFNIVGIAVVWTNRNNGRHNNDLDYTNLISLKFPLTPGISDGNSSGVLLPHDL